MSNPGFRIRQTMERPDRQLVEGFSGIPSSNIADCMHRVACLDAAIIPFNSSPLLGCAFTVMTAEGDNLLFQKALDMAQPGDVLVIAAGGGTERSYCGEIMVRYAMSRGLAGFVVDGAIRDSDAIAKLPFPVYARGVTPDGPYKNGPGEIGYPVSIAGRVVFPGDILVGDADGIVVVRPDEAAEIARQANDICLREQRILEDVCALDRSWIDAALAARGCTYE